MTLNLAELKELAAAATPGPWNYEGPLSSIIVWGADFDTRICFMTSDGPNEANARFIAASRTAIPALVAEVERLREALEWYAANEVYCKTFGERPEVLSPGRPPEMTDIAPVLIDSGKRARAALGGKHE